MIKILKASAGSGKTYRLSHTYLDMLMSSESDYGYKDILAVTFTNKATDEMKGRILKDLWKLSKSGKPEAAKAGRVLSNLLHDYSAFSVSTIDRFFQQVLRAFARELGHFAAYEVELDKEKLSTQAVDNILDALSGASAEDREFIEFIIDNMSERLADGKSADIEGELKKMALKLLGEDFRVKAASLGLDVAKDYDRESLLALKKRCREIMKNYADDLSARAKDILSKSRLAGFVPEDFSGGSHSWFRIFLRFDGFSAKDKLPKVSDTFLKCIGDHSKWFAASQRGRLPEAEAAFGDAVTDFGAAYNAGLSDYLTAKDISSNLYGLGIASRLFSAFRDIQKEEGVVCLDESNSLLRDIIDGSDAPFVYEKVGVRLKHFLLDEFQDTSVSQWENFLPLLKESDSNDPDKETVRNLIVGDVKQSIYRWRESDWGLLDHCVQEEFPGAVAESMQENYRSFKAVVDFNNLFYKDILGALDAISGAEEAGLKKVSDIYSDVKQEVGKEDHNEGGFVRTEIFGKDDDQCAAIVSDIRELHEKGVNYGEMAVLVRRNDDGSSVAEALVAEGIPIITEATLFIKSSVTVRRIVSLMSFLDNPEDGVGSLVARQMNLKEIPSSYHSLPGLFDLLQSLVAADERFAPDCSAESAYVSAFADYLLDYSTSKGNNLREFLRFWEDENPTITSPLGTDAVNILTIHKSKGLAFPYVFVPFLEKLDFYHRDTRAWCVPDVSEDVLPGVSKKLFYVPLSQNSLGNAFREDYLSERYNQTVDAVNMMYVATTRARKGMVLMGAASEKKSSNFADILASSAVAKEALGKPLLNVPDAPSDLEPEESSGDVYALDYKVHPLGERLSIRPFAADYFTPEDDSPIEGLSCRERGVVLHDILSRVRCPEDLDAAAGAAVVDGSLPVSALASVKRVLNRNIAKHPEYFPAGATVLCEMSVTGADGKVHRPDRVIIRPDGSVLIVDYKFGREHPEYQQQVDLYADLFRKMGYKDVKGELWYIS